jgi:hypothetical protein
VLQGRIESEAAASLGARTYRLHLLGIARLLDHVHVFRAGACPHRQRSNRLIPARARAICGEVVPHVQSSCRDTTTETKT